MYDSLIGIVSSYVRKNKNGAVDLLEVEKYICGSFLTDTYLWFHK